jgi:hypothetical protein
METSRIQRIRGSQSAAGDHFPLCLGSRPNEKVSNRSTPDIGHNQFQAFLSAVHTERIPS